MCSGFAPPLQKIEDKGEQYDKDAVEFFNNLQDNTKVIRELSVEEIIDKMIRSDDTTNSISKISLFQYILGFPGIVRELLLSNPLISDLVTLNPGLQDILRDDDFIKQFTTIFLDHSSTNATRFSRIQQLIKERLGHSLVYGPQHVRLMSGSEF